MSKVRLKFKRKYEMKPGDFWIVLLTVCLVIFGIIMVFSASYYNAISDYQDAYHYLKRDVFFAATGFILMIFAAVFPYDLYKPFAPMIMIVSIVLLGLLFTPLGIEGGGAVRWIGVAGFTIMPGEIAKISAIIFVSWYLARDPETIKSFSQGIIPMLFLIFVYAGLICLQPNLSTAITVCGIIVGIMFFAGMHIRYLIGLAILGTVGVMGLIFSDKDGHWFKRFTSFLDPFADKLGDGYQVVQSLMALGSGGLFGAGPGKSIQKNLYLPEPQNDFILAIIGEELGFIGILLLMIAYLLLIWRCVHVALNAKDMFGSLLAAGITTMLALQVIMNFAVVTSSMPPTGVSLPFISYGGNALWIFMYCMGIMLNISRHSAR